MHIKIVDDDNNCSILEGDYFYDEGGIHKDGKASLYVQIITEDNAKQYKIYFEAKNGEDLKKHLRDLIEWIK